MRKLLLFLKAIFFVMCFILISCNGNKTIKWWVSTENKSWEEQRNVLWSEITTPTDSFDIEVFPDSTLQIIDGFGGCINEKGWEALITLPNSLQKEVLQRLFSSSDDLHFNYCRMPIGASDYALDYYSLNDSVDDYFMENFSIDRDKKNLIPYLKAALDINDNIKIWASPWTPPAWMKKNNNYACASNNTNGLSPDKQGKEGENLIIANDTILKAYALYLSKFVKEYNDEDIEIAQLHVQNEFNSCQVFPSCTWDSKTLSSFIGNYLGPRFKKNKIETEIWLGTIERSDIGLIDTILETNGAKDYIKGMGFQWAGKGAIAAVHKKYPEMPLMQTETECGDGANSWSSAEYTFDLMKHYFESGANVYMAWNMVLEQSGLSAWGWKQNALISVDTLKRNIKINPEFWLFKHFSHYVEPESHLLKTSSSTAKVLAFLTPDKQIILVVNNQNSEKQKLKVKIAKHYFEIQLLPHSFNTLLCHSIR